MPLTDRAQRLKMDTREALLANLIALRRQRREAIRAGDGASVDALQADIDKLLDLLDDLSFLSLEALEDSDELRQTIAELKQAADALEDEADNITTVAEALQRSARIIDQGIEIIGKLKQFIPLPIPS